MDHQRRPPANSPAVASRPYWSQALRALREARGITQDSWATQLGYGRATVRRWEAGESVPSADAEAAILNLCREKGLFRAFTEGPLAGVRVTPEWLTDLLASARLGGAQRQAPAPAFGTTAPAPVTPAPPVRYALSGDVAIAYQVFGSGPLDLVVTPGAVSHREVDWEHPGAVRFFGRLASFARVIIFDKRGTGMSDRVAAGTIEERMDDIRAVMEAVGVQRAALFGVCEGGPLSVLFAATYPERTQALVLYGTYAYRDEESYRRLRDSREEWQRQIERARRIWGDPGSRFLEVYGPSVAGDPEQRAWWARHQRMSASPGAAVALMRMNADIDVRHVLPAIHVPTLVLHRTDERVIGVEHGRYIAAHIPEARMVELPGVDHLPWLGDVDSITSAVEIFLTGERHASEADSVLASVLCAEIVGSPTANGAGCLQAWEDHHALMRRELARYCSRVISTTADRFLATFDGPTRAVRGAGALRRAARSLGLAVRAGLHVGEVQFIGERVVGTAVDISVALAAMAHPGELLVSSTVTGLLASSGLQFARRGTFRLRGTPGQWQIFTLLGES